MTVKQYTGRANINIYHGDCMEFMKDKPAKSYDLAICDPEFGIGIGHSNRLVKDKGWVVKNWDNKTIDITYFDILFSSADNQIIWGGNYYTLPSTKHCIIWDKKQPETFSFGMFDFAWTNFDKPNKIFRYSVLNETNKIHPTQKPVALYKWLLQNYAKAGDKILDTHGGSMSIAIACWDLGFDLDIIELDKDYYDKAVERFERHINQKQLF